MIDVCQDCALRLYNKSYNLHGVGNPFYGNCIVVPNVDYSAYKGKSMSFSAQVEVINSIINPSTGEEDSNYFITPLIRCNEQISCRVDQATYNRCLYYFAQDMKTYNFKNILLLGSAARRFLNCNIKDYLTSVMISKNGRRYFVNYSPLVQYTDKPLFETFKSHLLHWYACVNTNQFDYKIVKV